MTTDPREVELQSPPRPAQPTGQAPGFCLDADGDTPCLRFSGRWLIGQPCPEFEPLRAALAACSGDIIAVVDRDFEWDSLFATRLHQCWRYLHTNRRHLDIDALPAGIVELTTLATAVSPRTEEHSQTHTSAGQWIQRQIRQLRGGVEFLGQMTLAIAKLVTGRASTRRLDFFSFIQQAGPDAIGIITLISVLVGMILAYLGAVQLQLFGAEIYVANLVAVGMVREMGALMTAVIMAGRTGAAYAAQLGSMQANEEVDAITTLGISPMEFLVLPRMLALVCVMPLLCLYSDLLGILGGALVAIGMNITPIQFINQVQGSIGFGDVVAGLCKSLVFGVLIAYAGCKAGMESGRNSSAVGMATTKAVVTAIVYLVVADTAINILYSKLGI